MVNKKILEKLSDKELELYITPESRFVSEAKVYAFEILKSRNYNFSTQQIDAIDSLIKHKESTLIFQKQQQHQNKTKSKITLSPFIIIFGLFGVFLFFASINYLFINNEGGGSLGAVFTIIGLIITIFILVCEQQLLYYKNIRKQNVWWIESLIILSLVVYIYINGFSIG